MFTSLTNNLNAAANATANCFTFNKAERFKTPGEKKPEDVKFRFLGTTFNKRSTSFGYGQQH